MGIPAGGSLPFTILSAASSYLDWILMASNGAKNTLDVKNVPVKDLLVEEAKNQEEKAKIYLELEQLRKAQPEKIPGAHRGKISLRGGPCAARKDVSFGA